jgi:hypothetical protein
LAHVVACDETPLRVGPRKVKKHLLVACTALYTWYEPPPVLWRLGSTGSCGPVG